MKHVKIFKQYTEENLSESKVTNSIFRNWMNDNSEALNSLIESMGPGGWDDSDWSEDDTKLSRGEKTALSRDFQILSRPQMAALYLKALGKMQDEPGKYLVMIDGILPFGEYNRDSREFEITNPALADAIGLDSTRTLVRTVNKFYNIISGEGETPSEALYTKIINAYKVFSGMRPQQVASLASEAIQNPEEFTKNRDRVPTEASMAAAKRVEKKVNQLKVGEMVHSLIKSLKSVPAFKDLTKARSTAVNKIAGETGLTPEKVLLAYDFYKRDKGIQSFY